MNEPSSHDVTANPSDVIILSPSPNSDSHPLHAINPRSIELPAANWGHFKSTETSLIIVELTTLPDSTKPRVRKHVQVDLTTGNCISYVLDRKISEVPALTSYDVERCIEELHMMCVCVGGPTASDYPTKLAANAYVDPNGKWRHNGCKIYAPYTGLPCNACESLAYKFAKISRNVEEKKMEKPENFKKLRIGNLSHRKQSQIIALRKRRHSWNRKRREAEKEMKLIEEMVAEIMEEPEKKGDGEDEDDDEGDEKEDD